MADASAYTIRMSKRFRNKTVSRSLTFPLLTPAGNEKPQGWATFAPTPGHRDPVRVFTDDDIKKALDRLQGDPNYLAILELMNALETRDPLALENARARFERLLEQKRKRADSPDARVGEVLSKLFKATPEEAEDWFYGFELVDQEKNDPRWLLSSRLSDKLKGVRLVMWWTESRFLPALYCSDVSSAIYAKILLSKLGGRGFAVCPHCGVPFLQERSDQIYCSAAHRDAHRVLLWRKKKRAAEQRKKKDALARKTKAKQGGTIKPRLQKSKISLGAL